MATQAATDPEASILHCSNYNEGVTEAEESLPLQVIFLVEFLHTADFFTDCLHFSIYFKSYQQKLHF